MSKRMDRIVKRRNLKHIPFDPDEDQDPIANGCGVTTVGFDRPIPPEAVCHYCGRKNADTRDHIVPKAKLGTDAWWNLVPSCEPCNRKKSEKDTTCMCAFCKRAVFLFELGHKRMVNSPRTYYIQDPKEDHTQKKSFRGST